MRITVWEHREPMVSLDPARYHTEAELLKALRVQQYPDQEFCVRIDDADKRKDFLFDGSDALDILAVLCFRGLVDIVFDLDIPAYGRSRYMKKFTTPEKDILLKTDGGS